MGKAMSITNAFGVHELERYDYAAAAAGGESELLEYHANVLQALDRILSTAGDRHELRGVLFSSEKPGMFIAGMDVEQIALAVDRDVVDTGRADDLQNAVMNAGSCDVSGCRLTGGAAVVIGDRDRDRVNAAVQIGVVAGRLAESAPLGDDSG